MKRFLTIIIFFSVMVFTLLNFMQFSHASSTCYGTTSNGKLEGGVSLPSTGNNFTVYSYAAYLAGRTYVHSKVKKIILAAYKSLEKSNPDRIFKYGETGFQSGGIFKPHKTHRNGLSVDFFVPVLNEKNQSVYFKTDITNKLGYSFEFDNNGKFGNLTIDFEAMGAHLVALHKASEEQGQAIWRVIFDVKLQPLLFKSSHGAYLKKNLKFSKRRSWVRHDEHYHVDFKIPCNR